MIDIYNQKLEKYDDGERHIFVATFDRPSDRRAIFTDLKVDDMKSVVVERIALNMTKTFRELDLQKGDVIQFEAIVKKNNKNEYTVERPTKAEKIDAAADHEQSNVHVVSDDWNWFEK